MGVIGIVPARGGSKGLKDKNIKLLSGKPMIEYTIEAAIESECFDELIVSSDSETILDVASKYDVTLSKRPEYLASDNSSSDQVIESVLQEFQKQESALDVVLLQPTSPLRSSADIRNSLDLYNKFLPNLLVSVSKIEFEIQKTFVLQENGFLKGLLSPEAPFSRRQDLPDVFLPNGAIYIFSAEQFNISSRIPRDKIYPFVMDAVNSIDIDTLEDFLKAEEIINKRTKK